MPGSIWNAPPTQKEHCCNLKRKYHHSITFLKNKRDWLSHWKYRICWWFMGYVEKPEVTDVGPTHLFDKFHAALTECLNKLFLNEGFYVQCNSVPQAVSFSNLGWRMSSFCWNKSMRWIVSRGILVSTLCSGLLIEVPLWNIVPEGASKEHILVFLWSIPNKQRKMK